MRLQRLEITGFKSFSDRSALAFDDGVTAIVGPNGCGKSNVADAITWVLGEQSARSLRGDRMEDVIFNGSDARKPTGTAEVRLLLTGISIGNGPANATNGNGHAPANGVNGHGHAMESSPNGHTLQAPDLSSDDLKRHVEVTRRLYRSGESEYLIDGQPCRLKDIHELLMDTGLGAKAYSIIEQGKIGMILSSRPADRRQLIEEAAGITKYKARRRAAELKLEAAQQNLTRIDDIVFEVEKQRGTLKRQAAKARRYRRLREELRRWEKVLLAGRYRDLSNTIASAREQLADARAREAAAAARVAEIETALSGVRISLAEAESRASAAVQAAHGRELEMQRRQQQIELDRQQCATLETRVTELDGELAGLETRREPARLQLEERRGAVRAADAQKAQAFEAVAAEQEAHQAAMRELEGLEGDVEAARSEVFAAVNAATALQHALQHAAAGRERVSETIAKLDVEDADLRTERESLTAALRASTDGLAAAQGALEEARQARNTHEAALAAARDEYETLSRALRTREHDLAALTARLRSLEELDAARAGYGDAARVVLAAANGAVDQLGAVADYLEVDRPYERAVEALLGDLLQHVIVRTHAHAEAGLRLVREQRVGRCGFLVLDASASNGVRVDPPVPGLRPLGEVARASGEYAGAIQAILDHAWISDSFAEALPAARLTSEPVATRDGDVFRGARLVNGGAAAESRGILATKGEIRELRDRIAAERSGVEELTARVATTGETIADAQRALVAAVARLHHHEKEIVGFDAQLSRVAEDEQRLGRKAGLLAVERARAEEEGGQLDRRQAEVRESISRIEAQQREADARFNAAQRQLFAVREKVDALGYRVSEAKATHAALIERAAALVTEVSRLEDAASDLEKRISELRAERTQKSSTRNDLLAAVAGGLKTLDEDVHALERERQAVREAEVLVAQHHTQADLNEHELRTARATLDGERAHAGDVEVARATAEADLTHLAGLCSESLQMSLDNVLADVERLEREGGTVPDAQTLVTEDPEESPDEPTELGTDGEPALSSVEGTAPHEATAPVPSAGLTAEQAITVLRARIDRLGPVNMMAIEQFDELETRHGFLTTQRKDLVDSIAQTGEAITRIDETSKVRFREAFSAISQNFQKTFSALFGGGRAGLTLLDDLDPLESGIDIVASPPGKRLQSVQLLSGGEKALTAIALMFAIFQYKPSPFCLLDEIDAPLDDANIGRFVEMLKGMLDRTQFILITHNRKTMEIADRLYGVTMEEPGVSKLISVRLN